MEQPKRNSKFDVECSPIPAAINAKKSWGKYFGRDCGCGLLLPYQNVAAIFFDNRLMSGDYETILKVIDSEEPVAHIITCEGSEWVARAESTGKNKAGILVCTSTGKAIMSGTASIAKNGEWKCSARTVYPGVRNKKRVTIEAGCEGGTGGVRCGVRGTFEW